MNQRRQRLDMWTVVFEFAVFQYLADDGVFVFSLLKTASLVGYCPVLVFSPWRGWPNAQRAPPRAAWVNPH